MPSLLSITRTLGPRRAIRIARHRLKQAALEQSAWFNTNTTHDDNAVFILGCGRSGTTLLRERLARHPNLAGAPETHILCDHPSPKRLAQAWGLPLPDIRARIARSRSPAELLVSLQRLSAERQHKPRWIEKTPRNIHYLPRLLASFPNARFIHVLRDGRDVACSRANFRQSEANTARAAEWIRATTTGRAHATHPRVMEIRYEKLVAQTEQTLHEICGFINEAFHPDMLEEAPATDADRASPLLAHTPNARDTISPASINRWRTDMPREMRIAFHRAAGGLLIATGYAQDASWIDE